MRTLKLITELPHHRRSIEILRQGFPLLLAAMGENKFYQFSIRFLDSNHSNNDSFQFSQISKNINRYLRYYSPWKECPQYAEIARFERFCHEMKASSQAQQKREFQIFSSHYIVHKKHSAQMKFRRSRLPHCYAIVTQPKSILIKPITDFEFRVLNWLAKDNSLETIIKKSARLKVNEKKFFKIYFKLQKLGFIEPEYVLN
ncbi:MAG: hypothetical protein ABL927_00365 [Bdellovibrionales bacterium]